MFGYATDETPELMPLTHMLATQIGYKLTEVRKNGTVGWLRPDGKTQVTVEYKKVNGAMIPQRVHTILISTQHSPGERFSTCFSFNCESSCVVGNFCHHVRIMCSKRELYFALLVVPLLAACVIILLSALDADSVSLLVDVTNDKIHKDLMEYVIKPVVPAKYMDDKTIFHLNPSGR